ncbi:MAG TPA: hypothetical protein VFJ61_08125 [Solirubrobacterales bacterium]|nr:hypothetical protein [Solirubrobacterales bacterium]
MKVLLALNSLGIGGTETYVFTVAEQLDRLAHEVAIFSPEPGKGLELAHERGLKVVGRGALEDQFDAALVQDAAVAYEVAERCPRAKSVFVGHSESFDPQSPPQLPGTVDLLVALNDRVEQRLRSFAEEHEVVRLRQPIDTERFVAAGALPEKARRALILSNNIIADRESMLEEACTAVGWEVSRTGGGGRQTTDPRQALAEADVVIGYGRAVLEAMACGRAAFVYDWAGGDGWVTAESFAALEADGFAGRGEAVFDLDRLTEAFSRYDRSMGPVNHDLVIAHHRANVHAQSLVEIFNRVAAPAGRPDAPLADMARLVRLEWRARAEIHGLRAEAARLHQRLHSIGEELTAANQRIAAGEKAREAADAERLQAEQRATEVARLAEAETAERYESTFSWRLTRPLRRAAAALRTARNPGSGGSSSRR